MSITITNNGTNHGTTDRFYAGTIRTVIRLFGDQRRVLYVGIGLRMLNAVCIGVGAGVTVAVIRRLGDSGADRLDGGDVWTVTAVLVASVIGQYVTGYFSNRFAWVSTFQAIGQARLRVLRHLQRVPLGSVLSRRSGDITAVLTSDLEMVSNFAHHAMPALFGAVALP
ncbi:MAG TPA: ABC transporter transmembrane domain-containing protein, partial [Ilumatobacteraceae bacterium]|nr:ABC transporter transmembrane domain-containing protein [Ilumatobacteraceae bacterium]